MIKITEVLTELDFEVTYFVQGRASVADLFKPEKRCGIYVLHFFDGVFYCGQAKDVTRRYVQHSKNHLDIEKISFKVIEENQLDVIEKRCIEQLEKKGFRLRNIALTSIPYGPSDFDTIMSLDEQAKWLADPNYSDFNGTRVINPELRANYTKKYQKFEQLPYATQATEVLRQYARTCLPAVLRSEVSFWGCSCLPRYSDNSLYSRVNLNWQEVFTIFDDAGTLGFSWHLAKSPLEKVFGYPFDLKLRLRYPTIEIFNQLYRPGGQDQINLSLQGSKSALKFLSDPKILPAIRLFNMRLMKKGPCVYSRNHCLDLADKLVPELTQLSGI